MKYSKMMECINKLIAKKDLKLGGSMVSGAMQSAIELWDLMYRDRAPWVDGNTMFSAGIPAAVAAEISRLVTLEMESSVTGSARAEYIDGVYQDVLSDLRKQVEYGCAKGSLVFKPYLAGDKIVVQYCQADSFYPLSFDSNDNMLQCAFTEQLTMGRDVYTRIELHSLLGDRVTVNNYAYVSHNGGATLGTEISLDNVDGWADLAPEATFEGASKLLIGLFRVPLANTIDTDSPLGMSVFGRSAPRIKMADSRYSQIDWEYASKEAAVHIATSMLKYDKTNDKFVYPGGRDRLYRGIEYNTGAVDEPLIKEYSPDIRDESYYHGFNQLLRRIEFDCCLAYGTLSDAQDVDKTAEEIKSSKQRSYTAVSDTQMALQRALTDLVDAIDYWVSIGHLAPAGSYEMSFKWDDSIVMDAEKERTQDRQDVAMGAMQLWEYRSKWYGEDEETAKSMIAMEADTLDDEIS